MIALAWQASRAAHHVDAAKLAEAGREAALASDRGILRIKFHIPGNKQIEQSIVVVVPPGCPGRPTTQGDTGLFRDVGKSAVVVVVIEAVLAEIGDVKVWPPVIVIIAHGDAESPAWVRDARLIRDVRKGAIVV